MQWGMITDVIVASAIAVVVVFACLGLYQWVSRKSLKKVDPQLLWMPLPLAIMAVVYFIFEKLIVLNVRPNGSGEPSFPSTHVMITATVFFITMLIIPKYVKQKSLRIILEVIMVIMIILICIGRVLANMHWPIDVVGGVGFAFIFAEIYYLALKKTLKKEKEHSHAKHLQQNHKG